MFLKYDSHRLRRRRPDDASTLNLPLATVKVQVGSADASGLEPHKDFSALNLRLHNLFNPNAYWSILKSGFQKQFSKCNFASANY